MTQEEKYKLALFAVISMKPKVVSARKMAALHL